MGITFRYLARGQAALSFVFLVGAIIVLIGITLAFLAISFINSNFGFQLSQRASAAALAGAGDALLQLVRNKGLPSGTYTTPVGNDSVTVTITQNSPVSGQDTILSVGSASMYQRKVQVITSVDPVTGQVRVISWQRAL